MDSNHLHAGERVRFNVPTLFVFIFTAGTDGKGVPPSFSLVMPSGVQDTPETKKQGRGVSILLLKEDNGHPGFEPD